MHETDSGAVGGGTTSVLFPKSLHPPEQRAQCLWQLAGGGGGGPLSYLLNFTFVFLRVRHSKKGIFSV